jgi:hypothetical protein
LGKVGVCGSKGLNMCNKNVALENKINFTGSAEEPRYALLNVLEKFLLFREQLLVRHDKLCFI